MSSGLSSERRVRSRADCGDLVNGSAQPWFTCWKPWFSPEEDTGTLCNAARKAIAEADEWLSTKKFLAEFGLTIADWEKMAENSNRKNTPVSNG